jgi:Fe-S-cluster containining protein
MPANGFARDFCNGCDRRCCSRPVVLPEEREAIVKAAGMGFLKRRRLFERRDGYYILRGEICPLLKDGKCSVEEVRPLNCRIFPLALEHTGKAAEWALSPECPECHNVPYEFVEAAKEAGQPLLERHRKGGPLT